MVKKVKEVVNLNKFERTRLLSARALELAEGDEPRVKVEKGVKLSQDYIKIATKELEAGKIELEIYHNK